MSVPDGGAVGGGATRQAALAHVVRNPVEAAYARSDLFERRRLLMDEWAAYVVGAGVEATRLAGVEPATARPSLACAGGLGGGVAGVRRGRAAPPRQPQCTHIGSAGS